MNTEIEQSQTSSESPDDVNEKRRIAALRRLGLLDTPPEERFERLTRIARKFYGAKAAYFSLIDTDRQWLKSRDGLETSETNRSWAFCDAAIQNDGLFVIDDAQQHPRFKSSPLVVSEPFVRFYAGIPVREPGGYKVGAFCIIDDKPRVMSEVDLEVLRNLASIVEDELERSLMGAPPTHFVEVSSLSRAIRRAQAAFLTSQDQSSAFELMLSDLLSLTGSQFGFIGEIHKKENGQPFLKIGAITNIAWSPETEGLYQQVKRRGMVFERLDNLLGKPLLTGEVLVSSNPASDKRRGGLPEGHPPLESYIAIPVYGGNEFVGLIGLANRTDGYSEDLAEELAPLVQTLGTLIDRNKLYSEKQAHQRKLEQAANYDELTGLPNRRRLTDLFEQELVEANARQGTVSVCFLDLDGFKEINDEHGHAVGDSVLKSVSQRLVSVLREDDIVSRLGGDEFVAILRDINDERIYGRILEAVSRPISYGQVLLSLSGSMGVAVYPDDNSDPDLLLRHADQAMYAAKDSGKNCYKLFDLKVHQTRKRKVSVLEAVDRALINGELEMHFQPKIDFQKQRVEGFEALIRWNHPEDGLLSPAEFLDHLEYTEYASAVGRFVLADAVEKLRQFDAQGLSYSISVNLSPSHFLGRQFISDLAQALAPIEFGKRGRLVLEVLETTALDEAEKVISKLEKCRELGVRISLDDFGTSFSSLDHFRRLPADEIKIDRSFVMDMLEDKDDEAIVRAVVGLSNNFSRRVVAEGVENEQIAARLIEMGCHCAQGYFYSPAIAFGDAVEWAESFMWSGYPASEPNQSSQAG